MVRTRIAPSPTGEDLHIGNLYTAYLNWAYAKGQKGEFIIRIEDTDRTRFVEESEEKIHTTLESFGITADESVLKSGQYGPYRQSERLDRYEYFANELVRKRAAYFCFCTKDRLEKMREEMIKNGKTPMYDGHCRAYSDEEQTEKLKEAKEKGLPWTLRLKVPKDETITFTDVVRGEISFDSNTIDDQILIKSDEFPTYHFAVVVDDHEMKITHVIRAEEWISSTPKHVLLYKAFGWDLPVFAHVPILRNADRSKLSKRKNPVWASYYLQQGFLPEAVLNFLALMGWTHPEGKEIFTVDEFISVFDIKDLRAAGPVFDVTKLAWMNGEYIRAMPVHQLADLIFNFYKGKYSEEFIEKVLPLVQERIKILKEFDDYCEFFIKLPVDPLVSSEFSKIAGHTISMLEGINDWKADKIGEAMQSVASDLQIKNGPYFMDMRIAMTGKKITPPLNESMEILGKDETIKRLKNANSTSSD